MNKEIKSLYLYLTITVLATAFSLMAITLQIREVIELLTLALAK